MFLHVCNQDCSVGSSCVNSTHTDMAGLLNSGALDTHIVFIMLPVIDFCFVLYVFCVSHEVHYVGGLVLPQQPRKYKLNRGSRHEIFLE